MQRHASHNFTGIGREGRRPGKGALLLVAMVCLMLAGCRRTEAEGEAQMTTASFDRDGSISVTVVESFDEGIYSADELRQRMADEESSYNQLRGTGEEAAVRMGELKVKDSVARLEIRYRDARAYSEFNGSVLFYGTVGEAKEAGLPVDRLIKMPYVSDMERIVTVGALEEMGERTLIVLTEPMAVRCDDIIYVCTDNMKVTGEKAAEPRGEVSTLKPALIVLTGKDAG